MENEKCKMKIERENSAIFHFSFSILHSGRGGKATAMNLFKLAIKNIIRARQRSWVTMGAMAFAGAIMIFYASLLEGWLLAMEKNAVAMEMGEVQIHAPDFRDNPDLYIKIENPQQVLAGLEKRGLVAAPRLLGGGLAAAGQNSAGVQIRGLDLSREQEVTSLYKHILHGQWLSPDIPAGVVVGRKLARILDVEVGDELVLVGQAADGSLANELYSVQGILKSVGEGIDRGGLFMGQASFRDFFALPAGVHEIVARRTDNEQDLGLIVDALADNLPRLEVLSWRQLQPTLARLLDLSDVSLMILLLITYTAVGILTLNAMLMSVFERIPEFGVMKAIGFSGVRLFGLILIETLIQVTMAVALALALGLPISYYFSVTPIDFSHLLTSSSSIAGIAFEPQWYCRVTENSVLMPSIFLYVVASLAILYPALKAALIRPVAAIHHR